ncbi:UDP-N-acetylmuramoyl-L-alanyl-D-glutamate--2,6-diaminopimelate ligase MurE [Polystyrenella longa]|uniref:UDP-N-acetylmuramoyl-L-alanyl-D-glutamate--2,6-diaminopimelate ligase n=1 Tax=Polystyrenella longa TaxID=2528007 RepID=A0A518CSH0_9PLAN|nr:UDP-N-acetylmuramoyl-L-alanyl-D-glutamate--2,6-diaminopimelate ligase [Polystyrenella longa]QDU82134.1 UDP-N-acetylmuramoyl-L-alanyl-D-glutamate--2,6-diaminopimelate ligase MurE [Polystyrenella longa]
MFPVSLRKLFPFASFVSCADIWVQHATDDSRHCRSGSLFAAIEGTQHQGTSFIQDAHANGATAFLVNRPRPDIPLPQCIVKDVRKAYAELCAALSGNPSRNLSLLGVTGTNGKTSVTWMTRAIIEAAQKKTGLLGTIENYDGHETTPSLLTTPGPAEFQSALRRMVRQGCDYAVTEVSSHALDQNRVSGSRFRAVAVTNVTHDHLDYHENYEAYLAAKCRILEHCSAATTVVINLDDEGSCQVGDRVHERQELLTVSLESPTADLYAEVIDETFERTRFVLHYQGDTIPIESSLLGRHNLSNCLMAAALAFACGLPMEAVITGIQHLELIPGRMQKVPVEDGPNIIVDYAHTADALEQTINALKTVTRGKLFCVFGAGGDRDRTKRPEMGRVASRADVVVLTSDNPRMEDPYVIMEQIEEGLHESGTHPEIHQEADRQLAIQWALIRAEAGDTVLIAGKGHEKTQIHGVEEIPFDDVAIIQQYIAARSWVRSSLTVNH